MSATAVAVGLVLLSAIMHAGWNLLLKMSGDKLITVWGIRLFSLILAVPFVLIDPPSAEVIPYIIVSGLLHTLYDMALISAYHLGEYSLVYTFARGMSPALSALTAYLILDESLTPLAVLGLLVTVGGLLMVAGGVPTSHRDARRAIMWSTITAVCIATYTVVDAAGVRVGGNAFTYVGGVFITNLIWQTPITLWRRWGHKDWAILRLEWPKTLLASILQIVSYALVVFAFGISLVGYISSLRETGVVFAAIFGWWFFKDPYGRLRILGTIAVVAGVITLSVGGAA